MTMNIKSKVAELNPYHTVEKVVNFATESEQRNLLGVKNVEQIPVSLIQRLEKSNHYLLHTLDHHSLGGRAIDLSCINPITGRWMTGSSSGTAINVRCGINDLGIGTDGGGSVLAPALAVQCFGMICPSIEEDHCLKYRKKSTDKIEFSPSIGFITRNFETMKEAFETVLYPLNSMTYACVWVSQEDKQDYPFETHKIDFCDVLGSRSECIEFLQTVLPQCDVLIAQEGPIDLDGFGDTVFGHFDASTQAQQRSAQKGLIRVANMVNATCIVVPQKALACGFAILCESKKEKIEKAFSVAKALVINNDELVERYFLNLEMYFSNGYGG